MSPLSLIVSLFYTLRFVWGESSIVADIGRNGSLLSPPWLSTGMRTEVEVGLHIATVKYENANAPKVVSLTMYMHVTWTDRRLEYNHSSSNSPVDYLTLPATIHEKIWRPDIDIKNTLTFNVHQSSTSQNYFLRLYPNGTLLQSSRITFSLVCPLVNDFPQELQTCVVKVESYSYSVKEVLLKWRTTDPVDFNRDVQMESHEVRLPVKTDNLTQVYLIGEYSLLSATIDLKRIYSIFSVFVYIPSLLLVFLSWLSFWLDKKEVPARVSLCGLIVMSGITHMTGAMTMLDKSSIADQGQAWLAGSLVFMVAAAIQFVVVHTLTRLKAKRKEKKEEKVIYENTENLPEGEAVEKCPSIFRRMKWNPGKLDSFFRVFFPVAFVIFNVVYWLYYLT